MGDDAGCDADDDDGDRGGDPDGGGGGRGADCITCCWELRPDCDRVL